MQQCVQLRWSYITSKELISLFSYHTCYEARNPALLISDGFWIEVYTFTIWTILQTWRVADNFIRHNLNILYIVLAWHWVICVVMGWNRNESVQKLSSSQALLRHSTNTCSDLFELSLEVNVKYDSFFKNFWSTLSNTVSYEMCSAMFLNHKWTGKTNNFCICVQDLSLCLVLSGHFLKWNTSCVHVWVTDLTHFLQQRICLSERERESESGMRNQFD